MSLSGSVSQRLPSLAALALNFSDPLPSVSLPVYPLQLLSSPRLKFSPYHYLLVSLRIYCVSPDCLLPLRYSDSLQRVHLKEVSFSVSHSLLWDFRETLFFFGMFECVCSLSLTILLR